MNQIQMRFLLACASLGLLTAHSFGGQVTYAPGDLLLGVRAGGGTGADKDYVVNLGPSSAFVGATSAFPVSGLGDVKGDLIQTFGSTWSTRPDVYWSVSGSNSSAPSGTVAGEPARTLFATKPQSTPGTLNSNRWLRATSSGQAAPAIKMLDMAKFYAYVNGDGVTPRESSAASPKGLVQAKSDINSYASYQPGGTLANSGPAPGVSFAYFNPTIEGNFGSASVLELYRLQPGSGEGELLGMLSFDSTGTLMFHPASLAGNANIPAGNSTVGFQSATYRVLESGTPDPVSVQLIRGGDLSTSFDVTVNAAAGNVTPLSTLTSFGNQVVHFAANEVQKSISIPLQPNLQTGYQADRTFKLQLGSAPASVTAGGESTVAIRDNSTSKGALEFTLATVSVQSTLDGITPSHAVVTMKRSNGDNGDVTFTVNTMAGGTLVKGTDYTFNGPTVVTFYDGETSKTLDIPLLPAALTKAGSIKLAGTAGGGATAGKVLATTVSVLADVIAPTVAFPGAPFPQVTTTATGATLAAFTGNALDTGTSAAPAGVVKIEYSLNNAPFTQATLGTPGGTPTTFDVPQLALENGPNSLAVRATDKVGNVSIALKKLSVVNSAQYTALAGSYNGLLVAQGTPSNDNSGYLTVTVSTTGAFTGKLQLGGSTVGIKGIFGSTGAARFLPTLGSTMAIIDIIEFPTYLGALSLNLAGGQVTGTLATDATGATALATLAANKVYYDGKTPATTVPAHVLNAGGLKGAYSAVLPSKEQTPALTHSLYPQGDGAATITVLPSGLVSLKGFLADGTVLAATGRMEQENAGVISVPLFAPLYRKGGVLAGTLVFNDSLPDTDAAGADFLWIRPGKSRSQYYPSGWESGIRVDLAATKHSNPGSLNFGQGANDPNAGNSLLQFTDGLLLSAITKGVNVDPATGKIAMVPVTNAGYVLKLALTSGALSGTFRHSDNSTVSFKGALLNKGANKGGFGYFLSTPPATYGGSGQSGGFSLQP